MCSQSECWSMCYQFELWVVLCWIVLHCSAVLSTAMPLLILTSETPTISLKNVAILSRSLFFKYGYMVQQSRSHVPDSTCIPPHRCLSKETWQGLKSQEDPKLQQLADGLISSALHGKAPSTTMKYLGGFRWWKSWALTHNLRVFPSNELHVALY